MRVEIMAPVAVDGVQQYWGENKKEESTLDADLFSVWLSLFTQGESLLGIKMPPEAEKECTNDAEVQAIEKEELLMTLTNPHSLLLMGSSAADVQPQVTFAAAEPPTEIPLITEVEQELTILPLQEQQMLQKIENLLQQEWPQNIENFIQQRQDVDFGLAGIRETAEEKLSTAVEKTIEEKLSTGVEKTAEKEAEPLGSTKKAEEAAKALKQSPSVKINSDLPKKANVEIVSVKRTEALAEVEIEAEKEAREITLSAQADTIQELNLQRINYAAAAGEANSSDSPDIFALKAGIMEQVWEQLKFVDLPTGEKKLYVRLKPETLGQLEIRLRLQKGQLTAQIVTENAQVKQALEASLGQLRERLQAQQIVLTEFTVSMGQESGYGKQQAPWQQQFRQKGPVQVPQADLAEKAGISAATASLGPSLDLRA